MKKEKWTQKDETALQEMQNRKHRIMDANLEPLMKLIKDDCLIDSSNDEAIAAALVDNADAYRDALEPFDSGIRCAVSAE